MQTEPEVTTEPTPTETPAAEPQGTLLGGTPTQTTEQDPTNVEYMEDGWLKGVPKDIATDKTLQHIKDVGSLAKSYVHAQRMVGKDRVFIPNENSPTEEWGEFYSKMGVPSEVAGYDFKINTPEGKELPDEFIGQFKELAHGLNLMPQQAEGLLQHYADLAINTETQQMEAQEHYMQESINNLKQAWGNGFDKKISQANAVLDTFGDESLRNYLEETGLANDTNIVKFLAEVGANLTEDHFSENVVSNFTMTREEAQSEINNIMGDARHAYFNTEHPGHQEAVDKVNRLFKIKG